MSEEILPPVTSIQDDFKLLGGSRKGCTNITQEVEPQVGPADIAALALGMTPRALAYRFGRPRKPWPAHLRVRDGGVWLFDIKGIRSYLFKIGEPLKPEGIQDHETA